MGYPFHSTPPTAATGPVPATMIRASPILQSDWNAQESTGHHRSSQLPRALIRPVPNGPTAARPHVLYQPKVRHHLPRMSPSTSLFHQRK
jgi:hypothetical protein